jgi:hypothetical protein
MAWNVEWNRSLRDRRRKLKLRWDVGTEDLQEDAEPSEETVNAAESCSRDVVQRKAVVEKITRWQMNGTGQDAGVEMPSMYYVDGKSSMAVVQRWSLKMHHYDGESRFQSSSQRIYVFGEEPVLRRAFIVHKAKTAQSRSESSLISESASAEVIGLSKSQLFFEN